MEPNDANPSVLVVDDVAENRLAMEAALADLGSSLCMASSGQEALRHLLQGDFALILLDVQMPTMDGLETARLIRKREKTRATPIIFLTAKDRDENEVLEAYHLGAVDFLYKPINPDILRAKVTVFTELHQQAQELKAQAETIRDHERRLRETALDEQRRVLEQRALRLELEREAAHSTTLEQQMQQLEIARSQLAMSNAALVEADRKKDEFIAVLAHEIRNPLAALASGIALLDDSGEGKARLSMLRTSMRRQCGFLTRLVDDLLEVSRLTTGKVVLERRLVSVVSAVREAVALAKPALEAKAHTLEVAHVSEEVFIDGDPVRIAQVLVNLLANAARYTPEGGHIALRTSIVGDSVRFEVADSGIGMSTELMASVFEPFVQEDSQGEGLGIGLTLVKELVALHGGVVSARSEGSGRGSTFMVEIPRVEAVEGCEPRAGTVEDHEAVKSASLGEIVIIDDNEDLRDLTQIILQQWGHEVHAAECGIAGVELVTGSEPDVAIIDIGLPDIEGYEVATRVRAALGAKTPYLIALSGYAQANDRKRSKEAGFDLHLCKPVSSTDLGEAIDRALAQREADAQQIDEDDEDQADQEQGRTSQDRGDQDDNGRRCERAC